MGSVNESSQRAERLYNPSVFWRVTAVRCRQRACKNPIRLTTSVRTGRRSRPPNAQFRSAIFVQGGAYGLQRKMLD